jgi:uncharacterized protein YutE (UPF0331/DUF86 family)
MVRRDVAANRIARTSGWLNDAERLFGMDAEQFRAATKDRDLAVFYLFLALQDCIDLAAHWVADAGWGVPDDAGSTFDALADREAIPRELADRLREGVGLRNRIAHGYALLDYGRVQSEARTGIPVLRSFLTLVGRAAGL